MVRELMIFIEQECDPTRAELQNEFSSTQGEPGMAVREIRMDDNLSGCESENTALGKLVDMVEQGEQKS